MGIGLRWLRGHGSVFQRSSLKSETDFYGFQRIWIKLVFLGWFGFQWNWIKLVFRSVWFLKGTGWYFRKLDAVLKINLQLQKYRLIYPNAMAVLPYFSLMVFTECFR